MEIPVRTITGADAGTVTVSDAVFGLDINMPLIHQAAVRFEANQRLGTRDTKTRGEVAGGGKKPYRQKGTGRARQGSIRAPHYAGGGVVFGPHPRDFSQRMPPKMRRAALRSALSGKLADSELIVVENLDFAEAKTREMAKALSALGITRTAVICTAKTDTTVVRTARNIQGARTTTAAVLNIGDVLKFRTLILTKDAIQKLDERLAVPVSDDLEVADDVVVEETPKVSTKKATAKAEKVDAAEETSAAKPARKRKAAEDTK